MRLGVHARLGEHNGIPDVADLSEKSFYLTGEREVDNHEMIVDSDHLIQHRLQASASQATTPTVNPSVNGYIGCYDISIFYIGQQFFHSIGSVEDCKSSCALRGTLYAVLSSGDRCYCINYIGTAPPSSDTFCAVQCANNTNEYCGGNVPYYSVYQAPTERNLSSNFTLDPWYIARATETGSFVANFTGSSVPPIEIYYKVFHDKIPDVVITLFQYDCTTLLTDSSLTTSTDPTYTGIDTNPPSSIVVPTDIAIYMLGINVDGAKLYTSPVWTPTNPMNRTSGIIDFCVRADLYLDPTTKMTSVSFTRTQIRLAATLSENFALASLQATAVVDESTNQTASVNYQLNACQCDLTNVCMLPDTPVMANSALRICIVPQSPTVMIASVTNLELDQGGVPVRTPIMNGVDDALTTTTINASIALSPGYPMLPGGAVIETRLVSALFQSSSPGMIQVHGSVLLQFVTSTTSSSSGAGAGKVSGGSGGSSGGSGAGKVSGGSGNPGSGTTSGGSSGGTISGGGSSTAAPSSGSGGGSGSISIGTGTPVSGGAGASGSSGGSKSGSSSVSSGGTGAQGTSGGSTTISFPLGSTTTGGGRRRSRRMTTSLSALTTTSNGYLRRDVADDVTTIPRSLQSTDWVASMAEFALLILVEVNSTNATASSSSGSGATSQDAANTTTGSSTINMGVLVGVIVASIVAVVVLIVTVLVVVYHPGKKATMNDGTNSSNREGLKEYPLEGTTDQHHMESSEDGRATNSASGSM